MSGVDGAETSCTVVREANKLNVTMTPNPDKRDRRANIVVSAGGSTRVVSILQDSPALQADAYRLTFGCMEQTQEINVSSDLGEWTFDYTETVEGSCRIAREGDMLNVTMDENTGPQRTAAIRLKTGNVTRDVDIVQKRGFPGVRFSLPGFSEAPGAEGSKSLVCKVMDGDSVVGYVCNERVPDYTLQSGERGTVIYAARMNGVRSLFADERTDR